MPESPWRDQDILYSLYIEQKLSAADIGDRLGCSDTTVLDWLDRHGISRRDTDPPTMIGDEHPRSVSKYDLIQDFRRIANNINKTPTQQEYNEHGEFSWGAIRGHFDSMRDIQEAAGLEPIKKGRVTLVCEVCGDEYSVKHAEKDKSRFCSRECAGRWKSEAYSGEGNPYDFNRIEFTCEWCGRSYVEVKSRQGKTRFCSQECMIEWRSIEYAGENHPRWKNNDEYYRGPNWRRQSRKARERDDFECQHCGKKDESHPVHHIIPFDEFDDYRKANNLDNLVTLCSSCHSHVEWGNNPVQSRIGIFANDMYP